LTGRAIRLRRRRSSGSRITTILDCELINYIDWTPVFHHLDWRKFPAILDDKGRRRGGAPALTTTRKKMLKQIVDKAGSRPPPASASGRRTPRATNIACSAMRRGQADCDLCTRSANSSPPGEGRANVALGRISSREGLRPRSHRRLSCDGRLGERRFADALQERNG